VININNVVIIGRLTADPEVRHTQSGTTLSKFTVAVTRQFKRDETDFINCTAWGKTAELSGEYLRKGNRVGVQGSIRVSTYETEDKQKRKNVEIHVGSLEFLESKWGSSTGGGSQSNNSTPIAQAPKKEVVVEDEDDFPF